jgi:hypothetical protein
VVIENTARVTIERRDEDVLLVFAKAIALVFDRSGFIGMDSVDSGTRFEANQCPKMENRREGCSRSALRTQMELIENSVTEQRLAMNFRSRLRVICATPIQKRAQSHRSKRFLCCVCRSVR